MAEVNRVELFIELFSEEIPARMQVDAAERLGMLVRARLGELVPSDQQPLVFSGARRIAVQLNIYSKRLAVHTSARGPRIGAPDQAIEGFLRKHGATRANLTQADGYYEVEVTSPEVSAEVIVSHRIPEILRKFAWPKSMRWGGSSAFTWVRPLRRIICLLGGKVVKFDLRDGADDGHGLASGDLTEGHRFLAPGAFAVTDCADWAAKLRARHVVVKAPERRASIEAELKALAAAEGLTVVEDAGLLDEVTGLVEWPVPFIGRIDAAYMDLPAEVMQVSMRVNQRYFALCDANGKAAARFAFVANIEPTDGGMAMVAGNERVLRARFADARHFWDLDRTRTLESRVAALDKVTFHAKLGTQLERVQRVEALAVRLAVFSAADRETVRLAARLSKSDLTTGMVGEFPELQGVMGSYYAVHDGLPPGVAEAIHDHYSPKGPSDEIPRNQVGLTLALADKIELLASFFAIDARPTGSGDPFALRRAALGVVRIIREARLRLPLRDIIDIAILGLPFAVVEGAVDDVLAFIIERLRIQLRAEGARYDVLNAVLGTGLDDDLTRLLARTEAVAVMLGTEDGVNLLAAYRRAANILRIEEKKDGPHDRAVDPALLEAVPEQALAAALDQAEPAVTKRLEAEEFGPAMAEFAALRPYLDAFFTDVTVNDPRATVRLNRLALLARVRAVMGRVADFARIEG